MTAAPQAAAADGGAVGRPDRDSFTAFLSYSRTGDRRLATALQQGLHSFAKPWNRTRAVRVFRDDGSLGANSALGGSIERALAGSTFFVLLASPEAAVSEWVAREVRFWRSSHTMDSFLIVLTAGDIVWDAGRGDFDRVRTTALPSDLWGTFTDEPRYVDMRWTRTSEDVSSRDPRFQEAVADLAAPMHGRPKDELIGEDVTQHRRYLRWVRAAVAVLMVLALTAATAAVLAVVQRNNARSERDTAVSRELSAQSQQELADNLPRSALLALEAERLRPTPEARGALLAALRRTPELLQVVQTAPNPVVTAVVWSPAGDRLAWAETDGDIALWDVTHSRPDGPPLRGLDTPAYALAFSPSGNELAASDDDGILHVWNLTSPDRGAREVAGNGKNIDSLAFSHDGRFLAAAGGGEARLWSTSSWERVGPAVPGDSVAFNPTDRWVAVGNGHELAVRDIASGQVVATGSSPTKEEVQDVVFDPTGTTIATSTVDGLIVLWDVLPLRPRGEPLNGYTVPHQGAAGASASDFPRRHLQLGDRDHHTIAFSHGGTTLASGGIDDSVVFWDVPRQKELGYYPTSQFERVYGIAFSPNDDRLAVATSLGDVLIWNNSDIRGVAATFHGAHTAEVEDVAASRDGSVIASGDAAGTIQIWNGATRETVGEPMVQPVDIRLRSLALSPDGTVVAAAGRQVLLWDVPNRRLLGPLGTTESASDVAFSPDGALVAVTDGAAVVLWDVRTRTEVRRLTGATSPVLYLQFSRDGSRLAAGADSGQIILWDPRTGERSAEFHSDHGVYSLALSPDGTVVATGGGVNEGDVSLWDVATGRQVAQMSGHDDIVSDLAFSPDGRDLASASHDGAIFLWDVQSRQRIGPPLRGHGTSIGTDLPALVYGIAFAGADDLVSAGSDGHVVSWDLRPADWSSWACRLAGRNLSQSEWDRFLPGLDYRRTCADLPSGTGAPPDAPADTPR